jgi:microcystin-dependent protein
MFVGEIIAFPGSNFPEGCLVCDGSAVSREQYSALFEVIGTTYGAGDGSSTFNLPNLSGKVALGESNDYAIGSTGGEPEHVLLTSEMGTHTHEVPQHGHGNNIVAKVPALEHTITQPVATYTKLNSGGSRYGSSMPRSVYTNTTGATMSRATNVAIAAHNPAACTMGGSISACADSVTDAAGGGLAHDNMMPYLTLTYLIYSPEKVYQPGMVYFNGSMVVSPSGAYFTGKGV